MSPTSLSTAAALGRGLRGALQWRLWVLWALATLGCALLGALPAWGWLSSLLDHSVHADAIAAGGAPILLVEVMADRDAPLPLLGASSLGAGVLMLLVSPLLLGATVAAFRGAGRPGFGDLLRGAIGEYGPMLRMLVWSVVPLGIALAVGGMLMGANADAHEHAVLASELDTGRRLALAAGALLFVLAHASLEAGRGWLAADGRLRSALKAWWRGLRLLLRRPVAVLGVWLVTTAIGLLLAALVLALRQRVDASGAAGFVLALLLPSVAAAALGWGRIARLHGMAALAADRQARR